MDLTRPYTPPPHKTWTTDEVKVGEGCKQCSKGIYEAKTNPDPSIQRIIQGDLKCNICSHHVYDQGKYKPKKKRKKASVFKGGYRSA